MFGPEPQDYSLDPAFNPKGIYPGMVLPGAIMVAEGTDCGLLSPHDFIGLAKGVHPAEKSVREASSQPWAICPGKQLDPG